MSDELQMGILLSKKRMMNPVSAKKFLRVLVQEGFAHGDVDALSDDRALAMADEFRAVLAKGLLAEAARMEMS